MPAPYYLPINYPQYQQPYQPAQPQQNQPQNNNLLWVQGESAAKAYPVAPNNSVLLLDSESSVMYIKTTDNSGIPQPLRIFDYTERTQNTAHNAPEPQESVVTREEFEKLKEDVTRLIKCVRKPNVNTRDNKE